MVPTTDYRSDMATLCKTCGTEIKHTDTVGCCSGCRRVFVGLSAFDRHQWFDRSTGDYGCHDPAEMRTRNGDPVLELVERKGGMAWRQWQDPEKVAAAGQWWKEDKTA